VALREWGANEIGTGGGGFTAGSVRGSVKRKMFWSILRGLKEIAKNNKFQQFLELGGQSVFTFPSSSFLFQFCQIII
jgi:hypothetical protein